MKTKAILFTLSGILVIVGIVVLFAERLFPTTYVPPDVDMETVPLPRLVEHYEEQLDPEIPKLKVTATFEGESYELPYDASLEVTESIHELCQSGGWFMNLMNNFESMPRLGDGYVEENHETTQFQIEFSQPPDGDITIVDRQIPTPMGDTPWVYGYTGTFLEEKIGDPINMYYVGNHTHTLTAEGEELSFDLWKYYAIFLWNNRPYLRGLQIQCTFDGKPVEYYVLFRTTYEEKLVPMQDLSHLAPLES